MEMKNVVLTAVLALSCSAFADTVKQSWFDHTPTSGTFDRELENPVTVECPGAPETAVAVYRIIANISDLKVFAALPTAPVDVTVDETSKPAKASICAVDGKWYYYNSSAWTELRKDPDAAFTAPVEGGAYTIKVEYDGSKVTYKVKKSDGAEETSGLIDSSSSFVPSAFAFAGTGAYTSVVCEYEVTVTGDDKAVTVDNENGKIIIDVASFNATTGSSATSENIDDVATQSAVNGLKNWVNYVLGINGTIANNKPFAAPVQNSDAGKLEFTIGGVGTVLGETTTGAKVTYYVEELDSLSDEEPTEKGSAVPTGTDYGTIKVSVPDTVKYYRIKIKIDPAQ